MSLRRLGHHVRDAWEVPRDLLLGRYPAFVTGGPLPRGHVPVFVFHSLEPVSFERKLRHLATNGYVTLGADDLVAVIRGEQAAPERACVLTFDDGRGTLWGVGRPLLERYGMKGVVFLVPGRTVTRPGPRAPDWRDVEAGRAEAEDVLRRDEGPDGLLGWEEIEELARSGVYEFESHTFRHARVHTAPRLAGFVTPALQRGYAAFDVPLLRDGTRDRLAHEAPLGTPFFVSQPRTSDAVRFVEEPETGRRCAELVAEGGGEAFFRRPDWHRRLRSCVGPVRGRVESAAEREAEIRLELAEARRSITEHTGRPATHLCFPWHASSDLSRRLAAEVGYRTSWLGKVPGVPITPPGGDPLAIARIGEDWVELLPGSGRRRLGSVLRQKWLRRFGGRGV